MAKNGKIRLLLVDDHQVVRVGLRTLLSKDAGIDIVGEAGTMGDAVRAAHRLKPDVVLMDVRLPDGSGVEACREIRNERPVTRVLFLTSFADDDAVFATIAAGADGYLLKEIDLDGLIRSIKTVMAGQSILDSSVKQRVLQQMQSPPRTAESKFEHLSYQEQRVLALVAEGRTNKEVAEVLGLSPKTVKNYLSHVFEKLQLTRRSQAAVYFARRTGT